MSAERAQPGDATILVVDDEPAILDSVGDVLAAHGYTVLTAASGEAALQIAQAHPDPIALMLTDIVMPGLSGVEVAERLRSIAPATRVLFMSGFSQDVIVARGLQPSDPLLVKPFRVEALVAKVRELVEHRSPFARRPEPPKR